MMDVAASSRARRHRGCRAGDRRGAQRDSGPAPIGHYGCFSFFPSKNLGAAGDGGMIVTSDAGAGREAELPAGARRTGRSIITGSSAATSGSTRIQAAVVSAKLPHLDRWTAARQRNAALYSVLLADLRRIADRSRLPSVVDRSSHLQSVRDPDRQPRRAEGGARGARSRDGDLLPRADAPSGVLRLPRISRSARSRRASVPPERRWRFPCTRS